MIAMSLKLAIKSQTVSGSTAHHLRKGLTISSSTVPATLHTEARKGNCCGWGTSHNAASEGTSDCLTRLLGQIIINSTLKYLYRSEQKRTALVYIAVIWHQMQRQLDTQNLDRQCWGISFKGNTEIHLPSQNYSTVLDTNWEIPMQWSEILYTASFVSAAQGMVEISINILCQNINLEGHRKHETPT